MYTSPGPPAPKGAPPPLNARCRTDREAGGGSRASPCGGVTEGPGAAGRPCERAWHDVALQVVMGAPQGDGGDAAACAAPAAAALSAPGGWKTLVLAHARARRTSDAPCAIGLAAHDCEAPWRNILSVWRKAGEALCSRSYSAGGLRGAEVQRLPHKLWRDERRGGGGCGHHRVCDSWPAGLLSHPQAQVRAGAAAAAAVVPSRPAAEPLQIWPAARLTHLMALWASTPLVGSRRERAQRAAAQLRS